MLVVWYYLTKHLTTWMSLECDDEVRNSLSIQLFIAVPPQRVTSLWAM